MFYNLSMITYLQLSILFFIGNVCFLALFSKEYKLGLNFFLAWKHTSKERLFEVYSKKECYVGLALFFAITQGIILSVGSAFIMLFFWGV